MKIAGYPQLTAMQGYVLSCMYGGEVIAVNHPPLKGVHLYKNDGTYHRVIAPKVFAALRNAGAIVPGGKTSTIGTTYYRAVPNPADADEGQVHLFTGTYRECVNYVNQHYGVGEHERVILQGAQFFPKPGEPCYLVCCDGYEGWVRNVTISFMTPVNEIEVYHVEDPIEPGSDVNTIPG